MSGERKGLDIDDGEGLAEWLGSKDAWQRCAGRCIATDWGATLRDWVMAEKDRGTDMIEVLHVLASMQVQTFASIAAGIVKPTGFDNLARLYGQLVERQMVEHARYVLALNAQQAGDRRPGDVSPAPSAARPQADSVRTKP